MGRTGRQHRRSNAIRWKNAGYSKHVAQMANPPLGDEAIDEPFVEAARDWLRDLPFLPVAHARKLYAFDTTLLDGLGDAEGQLPAADARLGQRPQDHPQPPHQPASEGAVARAWTDHRATWSGGWGCSSSPSGRVRP